jgi:drug/metabolite transporter (DMT)-like permease
LTALAFIACTLIWSTTWFAIRVCIAAGGYPPFLGAAIRFALATVILAAVAAAGLAGRGPRTWQQRRWVAFSGALNALGYGLVYAGETHVSGGLAAVIFATLPLVTAIATTVTRTERPTFASVGGGLVSLGGIALIYGDRMQASPEQAVGVALVFASVWACATWNIILKQRTRDLDPLATNVTFLGATGLTLGLFALAVERRPPPWPPPLAPTLALLYLAVIGSVAAFALYFFLLKRMRLTALSTLVLVEPVLALLIDAAWEREVRLGARAYVGAAITLAGVAVSLGLSSGPRPPSPPRRSPP